MTTDNGFRVYAGDGTTAAKDRQGVPILEEALWHDDPRDYLAEDGLRDAVNVAITLGQPLIVTGEPGTGKTQLAGSVAHALGLPAPFVFHTKSTSSARDLFYRYDSLRHFHDAQFRKTELDVEGYVEYAALGLAILLAMKPEESDKFLPAELRGRGPMRSVVLVDEVDKAPRDLPNDILDELETMSFSVAETSRRFAADRRYKPILVLTSNSEKVLPDAFLRRCVYYNVSFPTGDRLLEIVKRRLGPTTLSPEAIDRALRHFEQVRELGLRKKPATAELIAWLRVLDKLQIDIANPKPGQRDAIALTYSILAKSREDLTALTERMA
jgi:MoxR-like ATPase